MLYWCYMQWKLRLMPQILYCCFMQQKLRLVLLLYAVKVKTYAADTELLLNSVKIKLLSREHGSNLKRQGKTDILISKSTVFNISNWQARSPTGAGTGCTKVYIKATVWLGMKSAAEMFKSSSFQLLSLSLPSAQHENFFAIHQSLKQQMCRITKGDYVNCLKENTLRT